MATQVEAALLEKAHRLKGRKRIILPTPPKPRPPVEVERKYYRLLRKEIVEPLERIIRERVMPKLPDILQTAMQETVTLDSSEVRRDNYGRELEVTFADVRVRFARHLSRPEVARLMERMAEEGEVWNRNQLMGVYQKVLGLQPLIAEPSLVPVMTTFIAENTILIRSIADKYLDDVARDTFAMVQQGVHNRTYAKMIKAEYGSQFNKQWEKGVLKNRVHNIDSRARLIARDQIGKYNGQLNLTRQTALGISKYRWVTSGDERVRDSHKRKNGRIYSWSNPPSDTGHPGEDYQCRCIAQPIFDTGVTENSTLLRLLNS